MVTEFFELTAAVICLSGTSFKKTCCNVDVSEQDDIFYLKFSDAASATFLFSSEKQQGEK